LTFPFAKKIVSNSYAGLRVYDAPYRKSKVIYNGFDFKRIEGLKNANSIKAINSINSNYIVGMVGSFAERKDYKTYVMAIKEILKSRTDIVFLGIGDGNRNHYLKMFGEEERSYVRFLDHQQDVESYMNICDVGVLTTFTEGISNSVLEFMALGKPVVVSGEGGCEELVVDGKNGFLMEPGNYEKVAEKILYLLESDSVRLEFGRNAKSFVEENFSMKSMVDEFIDLYNSVLGAEIS
jgi:glycosyltransferase involved in cell wall biosynthesis